MFSKILIANRGEIALRVVRACRELGIASVVAYSEADRDSLPVRLADEAVCIGPAPAAKSYLSIPAVASAALIANCDAIHPGYGFLAENPYIAEVCDRYGIKFIGPPPGVIEEMADKSRARELMQQARLPILAGTQQPLKSLAEARDVAAAIGYPVMIKAAAGGGGRGMRIARSDADLQQGFVLAQTEADAAFGNGSLYLEKYLDVAHHVEVQVVGDAFGNVIHFGERECSIQRRHQKLLEESPSPVLTPEARRKIGEAAVNGAASIKYVGAGTLEFLVDRQGKFYFMEMNTRIQVEHPVTEAVTGIDLVKLQIMVAAGERMPFKQKDIRFEGHAIECRLNAEDPQKRFRPDTGVITDFLAPGGPGVRVDSHIFAGYEVTPHYDSLLAKVIAWGRDREEARTRAKRAMRECHIGGVKTTAPFFLRLLDHPVFRSGRATTGFVETHLVDWEDMP